MTDKSLNDVVTVVMGAVFGGGGVAWFVKYLVTRIAQKIDELEKQQNNDNVRIAVLESVIEDTRRLRIDLEQRFATLRGEADARLQSRNEELSKMRRDVDIAHERLRVLASGDTEIGKVQAPAGVRR